MLAMEQGGEACSYQENDETFQEFQRCDTAYAEPCFLANARFGLTL
jgi:hypothetical protein